MHVQYGIVNKITVQYSVYYIYNLLYILGCFVIWLNKIINGRNDTNAKSKSFYCVSQTIEITLTQPMSNMYRLHILGCI